MVAMIPGEQAEVPQVRDNSPAALMIEALSKGGNLEQLEKFMDLQIKWEANEARKAYHAAMSAFKASPPKIEKNKHVKFTTQKGVTEYDHATLANVTDKISMELSRHGLSAAWKTDQIEKTIKVTCTVTHVLGHSESTWLSGMPDESGGKNSIQSIGSTVSYLQRYTLLAITGLATHDMDDDGKAGEESSFINESQVTRIKTLLSDLKIESTRLLKWLGVESIEKIPASKYEKAVTELENQRKAKK